MITTINEFKQNRFEDKLNDHVLAFFIKYGAEYYDNRESVREYLQNNDEDNCNDENIDLLLNSLGNAMHKYENYDNLSDHVAIINKETLEPIDSDIYEIDSIVDIISDVDEIKKFENAGNLKTTDLTYKSVDRNDIIWITCMLKPRNKSAAYPLGEMGVIKCKILDTFYGLNKLKTLKASDKIL
jgi:hypothetical protein